MVGGEYSLGVQKSAGTFPLRKKVCWVTTDVYSSSPEPTTTTTTTATITTTTTTNSLKGEIKKKTTWKEERDWLKEVKIGSLNFFSFYCWKKLLTALRTWQCVFKHSLIVYTDQRISLEISGEGNSFWHGRDMKEFLVKWYRCFPIEKTVFCHIEIKTCISPLFFFLCFVLFFSGFRPNVLFYCLLLGADSLRDTFLFVLQLF